MKIEQIYTSCLAQGAYYIESNGQAAVIDPLREVGTYIEMAAERGAKRYAAFSIMLSFRREKRAGYRFFTSSRL